MIQIAGKPVDNVQKALEMVLGKLKEEKERFKILESEIIEPELDEETTLFSGIIEVQVRFEDVEKLMEFIVDYTPNSVEIEEPSEFEFDSVSFTAILNDMSSHMLKITSQLGQANATLHMMHNKIKDLESKN